MHRDDYGVLAAEHRVARDAQQVEQVALAIAAAIAQDSRRFDPVEFLLAACGAATIGQLSAPMRGHVAEIFRTSEPRQRPGPAQVSCAGTCPWLSRSAPLRPVPHPSPNRELARTAQGASARTGRRRGDGFCPDGGGRRGLATLA
jgi:hypothetical protein